MCCTLGPLHSLWSLCMAGCCATLQLPRDELKRFVKETPFTSREVLKLRSRFARLDKEHSGRLSLQVICRLTHLHVTTCRLCPETGEGIVLSGELCAIF